MGVFVCITHNLLPPFPRKVQKYILYSYLLGIGILTGFLFNYISTPFYLLGALCIIFPGRQSQTMRLWNMTLFLVSWLWFVISDYAVSVPLQLLGYGYADIHFSNWLPWIYLSAEAVIAILPSYFAGKWLRAGFSAIPGLLPAEMLRTLFCEALVCSCIFLFHIIWGSASDFPTEFLLFNGTLFFGFGIMNVFLYINLYQTMQENQKLALKIQAQEKLTDYTRQLETHYQEMRGFRHDYVNLLSTLSAYIHDGDWEKLTVYFDEKIMPGCMLAKKLAFFCT